MSSMNLALRRFQQQVMPEELKLDYKDIISISYSNGGFESAWIAINTRGNTYKYVTPFSIMRRHQRT